VKKIRTFILILLIACTNSFGQTVFSLKGKVYNNSYLPLEMILIRIDSLNLETYSNNSGAFELNDIPAGSHLLHIQSTNYKTQVKRIRIPDDNYVIVVLEHLPGTNLEEITVSTNFTETGKDNSPVNIDIITPQLFRRSNLPTLMDAATLVNGVRPNINCNICNTGDIHINGMEGPYTLVLIDGMPLVSGLSSVYGLNGIPISMIERLEIAKGPASALYGSEAMGGIINVITKKTSNSPLFYSDYSITSYLENNLDVGTKFKVGKHVNALIGLNGYWYNTPHDINKDGFTDITQQKRLSLFYKADIDRKSGKEFSIGGRMVYEDRWGGENNWGKKFRGTDSVYGESINTQRAELFSKYTWPTNENITTQLSYVYHHQDSYYGNTPFMAIQNTAFMQTYWHKTLDNQLKLLSGISTRYTYYDDNTVVTQTDSITNNPENIFMPGIFLQGEYQPGKQDKHHLLAGIRADYHPVYDLIPSPRIAYKYSPHFRHIFRLNAGRGFRVVNVFTEDHASLTGARDVVFTEKINPETSYNISLHHSYKMPFLKNNLIVWELSAFYYHFQNKIIANYDADPNKVIYSNLNGYAYSRGFSVQANLVTNNAWRFTAGFTYTDVKHTQSDSSGKLSEIRQLKTPLISGNVLAGYQYRQWKIDITGTYSGPQRLPILLNDYRPDHSPWFLLLNAQLSRQIKNAFECYAGVKNILNFIPQHPIMRPQDPFDKTVDDPLLNPNGYTFDPTYNYAPIQGIKCYIGLRIQIN
jgi:outer membrane receptor for ferrienterochelin and colicins